jgi:predicted lipoprotein
MRSLLAAVLVLGGLSAASSAETVGVRVSEEFARPAVEAFASSSNRLETEVATLCTTPGDTALAAARTAFGVAVSGWGRVSVLRFGPLASDSRFERLFFWPDPRGIALKQVQGLLAEKDPQLLVGGVSGKSAALQGLPALEFTLFGAGAEALATGDAYRCEFAAALARNIAKLAAGIRDGWRAETPFARSFVAPAPDGELYRSDAEVNGELVKAISTALQFVRAAQLLPPLGEDAAKANGRRAPLWRSDLTVALMTAQADGLRNLLAAAGYEQTLPEDSRYAAASIHFEIDSAIVALGKVAKPAEQAFAADPDRGRFGFAALAFHHADELATRDLAAALKLTMGFNALDGD